MYIKNTNMILPLTSMFWLNTIGRTGLVPIEVTTSME
jgi:hypothetical protein